MSDIGEDLRVTSDRLLGDLDLLAGLEEEKRQLAPGDPRMAGLAREIEELARHVLGSGTSQRRPTEEGRAVREPAARPVPDEATAETARGIHVVLGEWREAERLAAAAPEGSPDSKALKRRVDRLREEYRRAYEAAREESDTPDWPDDRRLGAG